MPDVNREMQNEELASKQKSSVVFKSLTGVDAKDLHLDEAQIAWWRDAKLGLFVHWGLYALTGNGEWEYHNNKWRREDYCKLAERFNPRYTPGEIGAHWAERAKAAGMKYAVMVTRHHDGFAMWDSRYAWLDFCTGKTNGMDYVRGFTDACHEAGLYTGLYYSPMDWRFPGYFDPIGQRDSALAMKRQCYDQIYELMAHYGKIDILWYDGGWLSHKGTDADGAWLWEPLKLNRMARALQPEIMCSPRSGYVGDFQCDEGNHPITGPIIHRPWEKCITTTPVWGYVKDCKSCSGGFLIRMLADVICRGGNLLINAGPDPDGRFPDDVSAAFDELGAFVKANAEAIYGTRAGVFEPVDNIYGTTHRNNTLYVHIVDIKAFSHIGLPSITVNCVAARTMSGERVAFTQTNEGIMVNLNERHLQTKTEDFVIALEFDGDLTPPK